MLDFISVVLFITILLQAILYHEAGHYLTAKKYGPARIGFKNWTLYTEFDDGLPIKEQKHIFLAGIVAGYVPIVIYALVSPAALMIVFLYVGGCYSDFKQLGKLSERIV